MRAGGALVQLPLIAEQVLEEVLSHFTGLLVQAPSRPLVIASAPDARSFDKLTAETECPERWPPRVPDRHNGRVGRAMGFAEGWPPAISATVSSSFMAIVRTFANIVGRRDGSGLPSGPPD